MLEMVRSAFRSRPDLFLSHEEYKVLSRVPKTAERFYSFVHMRDFPTQLRELCRLQHQYPLAFGYIQDIVEIRVHTRGSKHWSVSYERLLVEDYERFPPGHDYLANCFGSAKIVCPKIAPFWRNYGLPCLRCSACGLGVFWCVAYIRCQKQSFPPPHGQFSWRYRSFSAIRIHQKKQSASLLSMFYTAFLCRSAFGSST